MARVLTLATVSFLSAAVACVGDDPDTGSSSSSGSSGSSGADASTCLTVAGKWRITEHCQPSFVGTEATVTQNGCSFELVEFKVAGTLAPDGTLTTKGVTPDGGKIACTGFATATSIEETCTPACNVRLAPAPK